MELNVDAQPKLHLQAFSLYWDDEIPDLAVGDYPRSLFQFYILLLSYRKVLMYDETVSEFEPLWEHLLELVPQWPGFLVERRSRNLIPVLECEQDKALSYLERRIDLCNRRANERTNRRS